MRRAGSSTRWERRSQNTTRAVFCENLIVLQIENKLLCYPMTYEKIVIPKYRVASVQFNKGGVLKTLLAVSWIIFWIGLVIVVLGAGASAASNTLSGSDQLAVAAPDLSLAASPRASS